MKPLGILLMICISTLCSVSCSTVGSESRKNWVKQGGFVKGPDSLLEGNYSNQDLWQIISEQKEQGDAVRLRLISRNKLEFTLLDKGRPISVVERKLTRQETYWSVGSSNRLNGVPPFVWGLSDNEVGLAVDREGNLHTSHAMSGAGFIGPIGFAGGSGQKISRMHPRISR